jgi:hypothetical protein
MGHMALWFKGGKIFSIKCSATSTAPSTFEVLTSWRIKWPRHVSAGVRIIFKNITMNVQFGTIAGSG